MKPLKLVIFGLSISSSWGNGHATTYRGLVRELAQRGHQVLFLERDTPWYAAHRDFEKSPYGELEFYSGLSDLDERFSDQIRKADFVMIGSYVPEGVSVAEWVLDTAEGAVGFYDIDTPVTLAKLESGDYEYLKPSLIPRFQIYLSFTGGPTLEKLETVYRSPKARPLYCSVDPLLYSPQECEPRWDLGYIGTYSADRQPKLRSLLIETACLSRRAQFVVAGPQYPAAIEWPPNVERIEHLAPSEHARFYSQQRFTLNITRADMVKAGHSPSVRLFEAAACGVPIISDYWDGLEEFFEIGEELLIAHSAEDVLKYLRDIPESQRKQIGEKAGIRVLAAHTAAHRAAELESYILELTPANQNA